MQTVSSTNIGKVRSTNQDAFSLCSLADGAFLAVVCDGMGGANGGNVASQIAVAKVEQHIRDNYSSELDAHGVKLLMRSALYTANTAIYEMTKQEPELSGMGTTVVAMILKDGVAHIMHIGDSRAYLLNHRTILQLTRDHSVVQVMLENGQITRQQAKNHPKKNLITKALGVEIAIQPDYQEKQLETGDCILICTDGLSNMVDEETILHLYAQTDFDHFADTLVQAANQAGGHDNITVVITKL